MSRIHEKSLTGKGGYHNVIASKNIATLIIRADVIFNPSIFALVRAQHIELFFWYTYQNMPKYQEFIMYQNTHLSSKYTSGIINQYMLYAL